MSSIINQYRRVYKLLNKSKALRQPFLQILSLNFRHNDLNSGIPLNLEDDIKSLIRTAQKKKQQSVLKNIEQFGCFFIKNQFRITKIRGSLNEQRLLLALQLLKKVNSKTFFIKINKKDSVPLKKEMLKKLCQDLYLGQYKVIIYQ